MYEINGRITFMDAIEKRSETFAKRLIGVEVNQQPMHFECINEKMVKLNDCAVGDTVRITFTIHCSTWVARDGKNVRFTSLRPLTIEKLVTAPAELVVVPQV
ncbi:MAG: DUF3127 domain-containing protein [Bacteroidia bacterium]